MQRLRHNQRGKREGGGGVGEMVDRREVGRGEGGMRETDKERGRKEGGVRDKE